MSCQQMHKADLLHAEVCLRPSRQTKDKTHMALVPILYVLLLSLPPRTHSPRRLGARALLTGIGRASLESIPIAQEIIASTDQQNYTEQSAERRESIREGKPSLPITQPTGELICRIYKELEK